MSAVARELVAAINALPDDDRAAVLAELSAQAPETDDHLSDETLTALADELFQVYDAEEAADATPAR